MCCNFLSNIKLHSKQNCFISKLICKLSFVEVNSLKFVLKTHYSDILLVLHNKIDVERSNDFHTKLSQ